MSRFEPRDIMTVAVLHPDLAKTKESAHLVNVAPHLARMTIGEDQRFFLPGAALFGAALLSLASIASKVVVPGAVFPIGIVTALIGVPFFLALVMRSRRTWW